MRRAVVLCLVGVPALLFASAGPAAGNTLYVAKSGSDWATGCTAADPCATINRAVSMAASSGDTIKVGYGTFVEEGGVVISKSVIITGSGSLFATVVRPDSEGSPVFEILQNATVKLSQMMVYRGSGVFAGGVENQGTLTLTDVRIFNNRASTAASGGGILNGGWLVMLQVGIEHNYGHAGLWNSGTAIVVKSWITGSYGGPMTSGIANTGTLIVDRSLIASNEGLGISAWNTGGSLADGGPTTVLTNVTISGNPGGGVVASGGEMTLTHATIAANGVVGLAVSAGDVLLRNSIVAKNSALQCGVGFSGHLTASGSLLGDASCSPEWPDNTNLIGIDPKLTALTGKGYKRTHALKPWSPAIDAAVDEYCESTDQRGVERPIDGDNDGIATCDIGAYEYTPGLLRSQKPPSRR